MSGCKCPSGVCRDPWEYLCVGVSEAATEWGVRIRDAYGVEVVVSYGPHRQTAEQEVAHNAVLVSRRYGEIDDWAEVT